jgi:Domain of unknown function (DUF4417)
MLGHSQKQPKRQGSRARGATKWHDENHNVPSMGCSICPEYSICGGLRVSKPLFWCLDYCCGNPKSCDVVCRNNVKFIDHIREIGGFDLNTVTRAVVLSKPKIPTVVPLLFHGNSRNGVLPAPAVALPFARMFDRRTGLARFESRADLCSAFKIDPVTAILLSGTDSDPPIENWWHLGRERRLDVIRTIKKLGIVLATSPNYSLFIDQPRWDDLHSMTRIAIVHSEMLSEGLQVALHVNGRTETDFQRWTEYIRSRPEIQMLAYEFATGTGWIGRRELHLYCLAELALRVGRPLDLIIRGGVELLPALAQSFSRIMFIDTAAFMRTMKRRRAAVTDSGKLFWHPAPTEIGMPLDDLLNENVVTVTTWIRSQLVPLQPTQKTA